MARFSLNPISATALTKLAVEQVSTTWERNTKALKERNYRKGALLTLRILLIEVFSGGAKFDIRYTQVEATIFCSSGRGHLRLTGAY